MTPVNEAMPVAEGDLGSVSASFGFSVFESLSDRLRSAILGGYSGGVVRCLRGRGDEIFASLAALAIINCIFSYSESCGTCVMGVADFLRFEIGFSTSFFWDELSLTVEDMA